LINNQSFQILEKPKSPDPKEKPIPDPFKTKVKENPISVNFFFDFFGEPPIPYKNHLEPILMNATGVQFMRNKLLF